ncbi:MAG: hypothetical protein NW216_05470 [Hyphomicrobium sp.]|nr:hypothetical protein [Hyphomicrobium sp.]
MDTRKPIDPSTAIENLFQIIRDEALANPTFARRLLEAVGHKVVFRGDEALAAIDPYLIAMNGPEEFRRTFMSMPQKQAEKIALDYEFVRKPARGTKAPKLTHNQLVDLMWERAQERVEDLFPKRRVAAE